MMTESGQIMVPISCPAFLIFDYINRHAEEAIRLHSNFIKSVKLLIIRVILKFLKALKLQEFYEGSCF